MKLNVRIADLNEQEWRRNMIEIGEHTYGNGKPVLEYVDITYNDIQIKVKYSEMCEFLDKLNEKIGKDYKKLIDLDKKFEEKQKMAYSIMQDIRDTFFNTDSFLITHKDLSEEDRTRFYENINRLNEYFSFEDKDNREKVLLKELLHGLVPFPAPKKTEREGIWHEFVFGIGKDHTAYLTMTDEAYGKLWEEGND